MTVDFAIKAIEIILSAARSLDQAKDMWDTQHEKIKQMQYENRDPSSEEWDSLYALVQSQSDELQR